jgi:hypothetical protein
MRMLLSLATSPGAMASCVCRRVSIMLSHQVSPGSRQCRERPANRPNNPTAPKNQPIVNPVYADGPSLVAHKLYAQLSPELIKQLIDAGDAETLF